MDRCRGPTFACSFVSYVVWHLPYTATALRYRLTDQPPLPLRRSGALGVCIHPSWSWFPPTSWRSQRSSSSAAAAQTERVGATGGFSPWMMMHAVLPVQTALPEAPALLDDSDGVGAVGGPLDDARAARSNSASGGTSAPRARRWARVRTFRPSCQCTVPAMVIAIDRQRWRTNGA